jgi:hypothetical protein
VPDLPEIVELVRPGWLYVGDYPPAFTAVVADLPAAHEDLDVQEIGRRIWAVNPLEAGSAAGGAR